MDKNFKNHLMSVLIGILLGIGFFWIGSEIPDSPVIRNHSGLSSIVLGLSLAETPDEVYEIIGGPENEEFLVYIEKFKSVLFYNLVFIVLYVMYFFLMIIFSNRNKSIGLSGILMFCMVILGGILDVGESFQLQKILDANSPSKMESPLGLKKIFSNGKWFLLFTVVAILSMKIWLNEKGLILKTFSVTMLSGFFFYLSYFLRTNLLELGILFALLGFSLFWVYSLLMLILSKKT